MRYRELKGVYKWILRLFSLTAMLAAAYQIFYLSWFGWTMVGTAYLYLLLLLYLPILFLILPATQKARDKVPWYDMLAAVLAVLCPLYYFIHAEDVLAQGWEHYPPMTGVIASSIMLFLVLEAGRRAGGWVFLGIMTFFAFYPLFARYMPGPLWGLSFNFARVAAYHFGSLESIVGTPTKVVGDLIIGFMLFAVALQVAGAGRFFMDLSLALAGRFRGAQAKVSVISSGFFASISGSPVANVLTTGSFTIPAMKRAGFTAEYAGGVEACASSGGILMPPIMGAAAFIMAEFLEIPYARIVIVAFIPALLYYLALFMQIDGQAAVRGLSGIPKEVPLPSLKQTLKDGWFFLIVFALLVWLLLGMWKEAQSPFYCLPLVFALAMLRKKTRLGVKDLIAFIEVSGRVMAELTAILACVGLIIGSLLITGVALSLSREIVELAGGNLILLLLFGAGVAFMLGIGMTSTGSYILLAILVCPALVQAGLHQLAVHLFALYWATLSFITPPVCLAAFTAASISGASPMKTGLVSMRLGAILFVVPFFFVVRPALILQGAPLEVLLAVGTAVVGIICWAAGMEGYLIKIGRLALPARVMLMISGLLFLIPERLTEVAGLGMLLVVVLLTKLLVRGGEAKGIPIQREAKAGPAEGFSRNHGQGQNFKRTRSSATNSKKGGGLKMSK